MSDNSVTAFHPAAQFIQTCGICGSVFRVEIESKKLKDDQQLYSCPNCQNHLCRINSSSPPRITLVSIGRRHKPPE